MILVANGYAARSMQQVKVLLRYPVKSLCSEFRDTLKLNECGVVGIVLMQFATAIASSAVAKFSKTTSALIDWLSWRLPMMRTLWLFGFRAWFL